MPSAMRYWTNSKPLSKSRKTSTKNMGKIKRVRMKWGKGHTTALTYGTYKRGKGKSYGIKSLDKKRKFTTTRISGKRHTKYPHTGDAGKRSRSGFYKGRW